MPVYLQRMIRGLLESSQAKFHDAEGQRIPHPQVVSAYRGIKNLLLAEAAEGDLVAINLPYDYKYLLSILACMEIGLPYVPLRPSWPEARIEQIRNLSHFAYLLDQSGIDRACRHEHKPARRDAFAIQPESLLYVIYTSGTTGEPKGVVIQRQAYEHFIRWIDALLPCGNECRILFTADFTFDMSLLDVALFLAKRCACYFSQFQGNIFRLAFEIESFGIHSIATVPNNLSMLLQDAVFDRSNLESLRYLLLGGSRFSYGVYKTIFSKMAPATKVYNFYGPTEATVYCHFKELSGNEAADVHDANVTIGRPVPGLLCKLVDAEGRAVEAPGTPGELLIGGVQVMKEYLRDPRRTQAQLTTAQGVTWYRSGDIAFGDAKGDYYITGRRDETLKRRGYRINLRDIDSYIQKIDSVSDCVTVAIPDPALDHVLVAFVVLKTPMAEPVFRQRLSQVLLDYQVPDHVEFRAGFPTNNSGKVCRETLQKEFLAKARAAA
jgi:acyl-coenzyme A synthetase/AMP-(fatty) acid ligase